MNQPVERFPLAEELIASFSTSLAGDQLAYRNHVCRELNFYLAITGLASVPDAVLIAAAFHDLGIWTHRTFDYLAPSVELAKSYLASRGLDDLEPEVRTIITEHHKIRRYTGPFASTVEPFRKADLIDLSLGAMRFGLSGDYVRSVRAAFPNAGFHRRLAVLTGRQMLRTPFRPLPMIRW